VCRGVELCLHASFVGPSYEGRHYVVDERFLRTFDAVCVPIADAMCCKFGQYATEL